MKPAGIQIDGRSDLNRQSLSCVLPLLFAALLLFIPWAGHTQDLSYPPPGASVRYVDKRVGERNRPYVVDRLDARQAEPDHTIIQPGYRPYRPGSEQANTSNTARIEVLDWSSDSEIRTGHPLIWKIDRPGMASSYIMGTIHVDDERVMALSDTILTRLRSADRVLLELKLDQRTPIDIMRRMTFTDGRTLKQVIGDELYAAVSERFTRASALPVETLTILKPWAAMVMLLQPGNESGTFLDQQLGQIARNDGIPVIGLETIDEQMSAFDDIPLEDQTHLLQATVEDLDSKDALYRELMNAYLEGDLERIVAVSKSSQPGDSRLAALYEDRLIDQRNTRMLERMLPYLAQGGTFVAIGALHLPGERGLLARLRDSGYRLTRLEYGM